MKLKPSPRLNRMLAQSLLLATLALPLGTPAIAAQNGTSIAATVTALATWTRAYGWTLQKTATPSTLNLFNGDSAEVQYTVNATRDNGTDVQTASGSICVTNQGQENTSQLSIIATVESKPPGGSPFVSLVTLPVDVSSYPVLTPTETHCYAFAVPFTPVIGQQYRLSSSVSILNHSGSLPGSGGCPGTSACPVGPTPKASFALSTSPIILNDTVHVLDSNGMSWTFAETGSQTYTQALDCSEGSYTHHNVITLEEPALENVTAFADVQVDCHELMISKTANPAFTREYDWSVTKSVDRTAVNLEVNQSTSVNYTVSVNAAPTDKNWHATGLVNVGNPSPIPATLNSVSDLLSNGSSVALDCGVAFPYVLNPGDKLICTYDAALVSAADLDNTGTAVQQNHQFNPQGQATDTGITSYQDTAAISFASITPTLIDSCVEATDSLQGNLGTVCIADLNGSPKDFNYSRAIGPYSTSGTYSVVNTATVVGADSQESISAQATVTATVTQTPPPPPPPPPSNLGCAYSHGYWKNHVNGPKGPSMSQYLPVWLGTGTGKSLNVLNTTIGSRVLAQNYYGSSSNGITKLYSQLLATKLNIKNGASATPVSAAIAAADAFLATKNHSNWNSLTSAQKSQVNSWKNQFDKYNNGLLGVPHCGETSNSCGK